MMGKDCFRRLEWISEGFGLIIKGPNCIRISRNGAWFPTTAG